jgi:hypothetical protein
MLLLLQVHGVPWLRWDQGRVPARWIGQGQAGAGAACWRQMEAMLPMQNHRQAMTSVVLSVMNSYLAPLLPPVHYRFLLPSRAALIH